MSDKSFSLAKHIAFVGLKAAHGFHAAHGPAKIAARVPVIGPLLGVGVLMTGTVVGAVHGVTDYDG